MTNRLKSDTLLLYQHKRDDTYPLITSQLYFFQKMLVRQLQYLDFYNSISILPLPYQLIILLVKPVQHKPFRPINYLMTLIQTLSYHDSMQYDTYCLQVEQYK